MNVQKGFSRPEAEEISFVQNVGVKADLLNAKKLYFTRKLFWDCF